ncbi:hypothetical protein AXF42_Ash017222 [Apostasia shenzhenica]|uniref:Uncharacterized protein n=1 Tax=Apostasia shenzhenica TaxID=1088818 RepID=A0A2H9ZVG3_9ASPA|nr:hypothetical protein AXF42_Ash017222 [Apostasia shenzhenica]
MSPNKQLLRCPLREKLLGVDGAPFGRPIRRRHVYPNPTIWHTWRPLIGFWIVRYPNPITSPCEDKVLCKGTRGWKVFT